MSKIKAGGVEPEQEMETPFRRQLVLALENFTQPAWLGEHSPLAAPYFLGEYLVGQSQSNTAHGRGQALRKLLQETAQSLVESVNGSNGADGQYLYRLLDLSFFHPRPFPQLLEELGIARATYYRSGHRPRAVRELEHALIQRIKPALRLEEAPTSPSQVVGREQVIHDCWAALRVGKTVALIGQGGVGKTTLAAGVAQRWTAEEGRPLFWYTFRPGLNDQLAQLLFAVGYFLQKVGATRLWLQLVAEGDKLDPGMLIGLLSRDLESLGAARPLFCFDEIDLLRPAEDEAHAQLVAFLQLLRTQTPQLLIGQQSPVEPDLLLTLDGLALYDLQGLLRQVGLSLSLDEIKMLHAHTRGNPRLIELFISLQQSGDAVSDVLAQLSAAPSVEFLLNRIWQRLSDEERDLLARLAVFRRPAPTDAFAHQIALQKLFARRLVQFGEQGGVTLLPAFKAIIYRLLAPEERVAHHLFAAQVRAERGEITAAAHHYIQGKRADVALWLWYGQRRREIDQGQGAAALQLFGALGREGLGEPEKEILVLLRSELRLLAADYSAIKRDLHTTLWRTPLLKARARRLEGDMAVELSNFDEAIQAYRDGLASLPVVQTELAHLRTRLGEAWRQKRDLDEAWQEAQRARYEVEHLQGDIQFNLGNYAGAEAHFGAALELAQRLAYTEGEGRTRNNLAWLLLRQEKYEEANQEWDQASACYAKVGRRTWQAGIQVNQATAYVDTGQPRRAVPLLTAALAVFDALGHSRGCAVAAHNLAYAHLALHELEQADHFAWQSLHEEETSLMSANFSILADIRVAQSHWGEAEAFARRAIETGEQTQDLFSCAYSWRTLAQVHHAQQRNPEATLALDKAKTIFIELDLQQEVEKTARMSQAWGVEC